MDRIIELTGSANLFRSATNGIYTFSVTLPGNISQPEIIKLVTDLKIGQKILKNEHFRGSENQRWLVGRIIEHTRPANLFRSATKFVYLDK